MNNNLIIVGAGIYGMVAYEIAKDMGCFEKISFVDDNNMCASNGDNVIGTSANISKLSKDYKYITVAIGNSAIRCEMLKRIQRETELCIATLISPRAYVSPSAIVEQGSFVEPMAVVHTGCHIGLGCIISAGAVVNHGSNCDEGVHVDCNATVAGYQSVPAGLKILRGTVFCEE